MSSSESIVTFKQISQISKLLICFGCAALELGCADSIPTPTPTPVKAVLVKATEVASESPAPSQRPSRPYYSTPRNEDSIVVGLDADMSSGSARSGEAIRRGLELAIEKINNQGGLLGKQVELIVRDHRGNPDRGLGNLEMFSREGNFLGVFGGIHTPVAIRELEFVHKNDMLYLCPWAAGTPIVANGYSPNNVFRVSVRDEYAGGFLVRRVVERGAKRIGLLLERTAWGRSNEVAMTTALENEKRSAIAIEWFNWGEKDLLPQVKRLTVKCDTILFVGNSLEGVVMAKAVASLPEKERPAIVSHWGITGGNFYELSSKYVNDIDLSFLQTFSFLRPPHPDRVEELQNAYLNKYPDSDSPRDIFSPVGTAHAYELMLMVGQAVIEAGSIDHHSVRTSLEKIRDYRGVIRDYAYPFPVEHHDALDQGDFILAKFDEHGVIVPIDEE